MSTEGWAQSKRRDKKWQQRGSDFHHPIAKQVSWAPLRQRSFTPRTHRLVCKSDRLYYVPTVKTVLSLLLCLMLQVPLFYRFYQAVLHVETINEPLLLLMFSIVLLMFSLNIFIIRELLKPRTFDLAQESFIKGYSSSQTALKEQRRIECCSLNDIIAIQLLPKEISSTIRQNLSYETNIVLRDASRLHVIDQGELQYAITEAQRISKVLEIPLWNAC